MTNIIDFNKHPKNTDNHNNVAYQAGYDFSLFGPTAENHGQNFLDYPAHNFWLKGYVDGERKQSLQQKYRKIKPKPKTPCLCGCGVGVGHGKFKNTDCSQRFKDRKNLLAIQALSKPWF